MRLIISSPCESLPINIVATKCEKMGNKLGEK